MKRALAPCLVFAFVAACTSDEAAPLAPGTSGTAGITSSTHTDSGAPTGTSDDAGADEDAGEGPALSECARVDPKEATNEDIPAVDRPSGITLPADFSVTRTVATWAHGCTDPRLVIKLSDGDCPLGDGHELVFNIPASAIRDGFFLIGNNAVSPEPNDSLSIRYKRTSDPVGTWGTCKGVDGVVVLPEELDVSKHSMLRAQFSLTLTDCSGGTHRQPAQDVAGSFNVLLRRSVTDYCPDWK